MGRAFGPVCLAGVELAADGGAESRLRIIALAVPAARRISSLSSFASSRPYPCTFSM